MSDCRICLGLRSLPWAFLDKKMALILAPAQCHVHTLPRKKELPRKEHPEDAVYSQTLCSQTLFQLLTSHHYLRHFDNINRRKVLLILLFCHLTLVHCFVSYWLVCCSMPLFQVSSFYCYKAEPASIKNLKRGVASLLQVQSRSGKVIEVNEI